jgi:hypothetical protein
MGYDTELFTHVFTVAWLFATSCLDPSTLISYESELNSKRLYAFSRFFKIPSIN